MNMASSSTVLPPVMTEGEKNEDKGYLMNERWRPEAGSLGFLENGEHFKVMAVTPTRFHCCFREEPNVMDYNGCMFASEVAVFSPVIGWHVMDKNREPVRIIHIRG